jgi:AcrR family transcriptional regulator
MASTDWTIKSNLASVSDVTRPLTSKGVATRDRIVAAAAELIRRDGVEPTALDDVRAETSTSKGQLFHYFPGGRADLLYAVAEHEAAQVIADQQPFLDGLGPRGSFRAWRDAVVAKYRAQGSRCPLGALTSQLRTSEPRIGPLVAGMLDDWHRRIADGVRRAGVPGAPRDHAAAILAAVQGGAGLMIATGRIDFLETALDAALEHAGLD